MNLSLAEGPVILALAGTVVGSFTATAVIRSLRRQPAMAGRSSCDHCGAGLPYAQTVPLVCYLAHKGVCRTCGGRIDPFHPLGEVLGALIGLCTGSALVCGAVGAARAAALAALGFSLLALSLADQRTQRIPNALTGVVFVTCLCLALGAGVDRLAANLAWAAGCFVVLSLIRLSFVRLKGEDGLGFGDVKLLAALAVWLGPLTPCALVAACVMALVIRVATGKLGGRMAFGPWISLGGWIVGLGAEAVPWRV